ncbi:uncharacterized protein G2W53_021238 [Senna tora]|uniref:Uncharacterized protein n=1 Tax=Senna tora TaxID=362788 RepID=A0A834TSI2_9FABA|nr:uncharacterized protein G2W53_021238 [Senna tora]
MAEKAHVGGITESEIKKVGLAVNVVAFLYSFVFGV